MDYIDGIVADVVSKGLCIPIEDLDPDSHFDDLGADSLDMIDIFSEIDRVMGVKVEPDAAAGIATLKDLSDLVRRLGHAGVK